MPEADAPAVQVWQTDVLSSGRWEAKPRKEKLQSCFTTLSMPPRSTPEPCPGFAPDHGVYDGTRATRRCFVVTPDSFDKARGGARAVYWRDPSTGKRSRLLGSIAQQPSLGTPDDNRWSVWSPFFDEALGVPEADRLDALQLLLDPEEAEPVLTRRYCESCKVVAVPSKAPCPNCETVEAATQRHREESPEAWEHYDWLVHLREEALREHH